MGQQAWIGVVALVGVALALGVGSPWWTGLGLIALCVVLERAGAALEPPGCLDVPDGPGRLGRRLVLGVAVTSLLATLAAFTQVGTLATGVGLVALAVVGHLRARKFPVLSWTRADGLMVVAACVLGLWVHGLEGARIGENIWYNDAFGDHAWHLLNAELLRDHGLPLVESSGAVGAPFAPPTHTGLAVLVAVALDLTRLPSAAVARGLGLLLVLLLALTTRDVALAFGARRLHATALGGLALVWGGLACLIPGAEAALSGDVRGVALAVANAYRGGLAGASTYHNLTQALGVVLAMAGLGWAQRAWLSGSPRLMAWSGALLGASALAKPSLLAMLGPAILIVLAARRDGRGFIVWAGALAPGLVLLAMPGWLQNLPAGAAWQIAPHDVTATMLGVVGMVAITAPLWVDAATRLASRLREGRVDGWETTGLALGGSILFALVFEEADPARRNHRNEWWPLLGMALVQVPIVGGALLERLARQGRTRYAWALVLALQAGTGLAYATLYPRLGLRSVSVAEATGLVELVRTAAPTPGLIDPSRNYRDLIPELGRPILSRAAYSPAAIEAWGVWQATAGDLRQGRPLSADGRKLLEQTQWVVVGRSDADFGGALTKQGFAPGPESGPWRRWCRSPGCSQSLENDVSSPPRPSSPRP